MTRARVVTFIRTHLPPLVVAAAAIALVYTGSAKLLAPTAFAQTIASHGLIPEVLTPHVAWGVITLELAVGVGSLWLIAGKRLLQPAAISAALVFAAFAWYAGAMVLFPPPEPTSCGCAGASAEPADWRTLTGRNTALAAALFITLPIAPRTTTPR